MKLEIHDSEERNSLAGAVKNLDFDYQAEEWVKDVMRDEKSRKVPRRFPLVKFILIDDDGKERAEWNVEKDDFRTCVVLTKVSKRYLGRWEVGQGYWAPPKYEGGMLG